MNQGKDKTSAVYIEGQSTGMPPKTSAVPRRKSRSSNEAEQDEPMGVETLKLYVLVAIPKMYLCGTAVLGTIGERRRCPGDRFELVD